MHWLEDKQDSPENPELRNQETVFQIFLKPQRLSHYHRAVKKFADPVRFDTIFIFQTSKNDIELQNSNGSQKVIIAISGRTTEQLLLQ